MIGERIARVAHLFTYRLVKIIGERHSINGCDSFGASGLGLLPLGRLIMTLDLFLEP